MSTVSPITRLNDTVVTGLGVTTLSPVVANQSGNNLGARPGDLLVMVVVVAGSTAQTFTVPAGWVQQCNLNAQAPVLAVFTKQCTNSDLGATVPVSWTTAGDARAGIVSYSNVDWTNPFGDTASASNASGTAVSFGTVLPRSTDYVFAFIAATNNAAMPAITNWTSQQSSIAAGANAGFGHYHTNSAQTGGIDATPSATLATASTAQTFMLVVRGAQTGVHRVTATSATGTAVTSLSPAAPAWKVNDLAILQVHWNSSSATLTDPTGWTLVESVVDATGGQSMKVYSRVIQSGDAAPAIAFSGSVTASCMIAPYAGVIGVRSHANQVATSGSLLITAPSVAPAYPGDMLLALYGNTSTGGTAGGANGMSQPGIGDVHVSGSDSQHFYESVSATLTSNGGGTGTRTSTVNPSARCIGVTLILQGIFAKPRFAGGKFTANATGTAQTVQVPASIPAGDLMLMFLRSSQSADSITSPPTGWTLVGSSTTTAPSVFLYKKTSTGSEPSTYSVTFGGSAGSTRSAVVVSVPGGAIDGAATTGTGASANSYAVPGITPNNAGEMLMQFVATASNTSDNSGEQGLFTLAAGVSNTAQTNATIVGYEFLPGATATGTRTIFGTTTTWASITVSVVGPNLSAGLASALATLTRPVAMQSLAKSNGKTTVVPAPTLKVTRTIAGSPVGGAVVQGGVKVAYRPTGHSDGLAVVAADTIAVQRALASAGIAGVASVATSALDLTLPLSGASAGQAVAYATEWVIPVDWPVTHVPTLLVAGTIYDHLGAPVSGATVKLFRVRDDFMCQETTSAADGSYAFVRDNTDPNTYYVVAYAVAGVTQIHGTSDRDLIPV